MKPQPGARRGCEVLLKTWCSFLVASPFLLAPRLAFANDVAPGLAEETLVEDAEDALRTLTASLDAQDRSTVRGIYVAIDSSTDDVLAVPACDDDGDYVVVLSHALLELVLNVSYASASDTLRGTHLVESYGPLLARSQERGARPLPASAAPRTAADEATHPIEDVAHTFEQSLLGWLVADELAHAIHGDLICPYPTVTHERADDEWSGAEHDEAIRLAPARVTHLAESDSWATAWLLERALPSAPVLAWLSVLAPLEDARPSGATWTYVVLHPRSAARVEQLERAVKDATEAARERAKRLQGTRG
jgi:hypothetical protein